MRSLGIFPSESDLVTQILPALTQADPDAVSIPHSSLEPLLLSLLCSRLYECDTAETLLSAFACLDVDQKGYLDESSFVEWMNEAEFPFREREMEEFLRVAKDPETGFIHYKDYLTLMFN